MIAKAYTPAEIEAAFQAARKPFGQTPARVYRACIARTYAIAGSVPRGELLAVRLDKGTGCSRRYAVAGEIYKTGSWGNGPGRRWAMAGFEEWYRANLQAAGIAADRAEEIADWVRSGYPWRALLILEEAP